MVDKNYIIPELHVKILIVFLWFWSPNILAGSAECSDFSLNMGLIPVFTIDLKNGQSNIVVGESTYQISKSKVRFSSFNIVDCASRKLIFGDIACREVENYDFCLPSDVEVELLGNQMEVVYLQKVNLDENGELTYIPIYRQIFSFESGVLALLKEESTLKKVYMSEKNYKKVLLDYDDVVGFDFDSSQNIEDFGKISDLIFKLYSCHLAGYDECSKLFFSLGDNFPRAVEGIFYDQYFGLIGYEELRK